MEQTLDAMALAARKARKRARRMAVGGKILAYFFLILLCLFFLFPFIVMICVSLLPDSEVYQPVLISPSGTLYVGSYLGLFREGSNYLLYLWNSVKVSLITAIGIPLVSSLCAYGFAKLDFKGREVMFAIVLSTMMIPAVVTLIPLQTIFSALNWLDTLYPMWVPSLFGGGATNIFLMRQFMRGIPNDMLNSAKLDGANSFVIYLRMMLPLCIPILLYVGVTSFMSSWNDFITPMTYLGNGSSPSATLALGIYFDYGPGSRALPNAAMAAGVVMTLPCAVLFFIFQRYLIEGVAITGMKG